MVDINMPVFIDTFSIVLYKFFAYDVDGEWWWQGWQGRQGEF